MEHSANIGIKHIYWDVSSHNSNKHIISMQRCDEHAKFRVLGVLPCCPGPNTAVVVPCRKENSLSVDNVKTDKVKPGYSLPKLHACPARSFSKGGGSSIKKTFRGRERCRVCNLSKEAKFR